MYGPGGTPFTPFAGMLQARAAAGSEQCLAWASLSQCAQLNHYLSQLLGLIF